MLFWSYGNSYSLRSFTTTVLHPLTWEIMLPAPCWDLACIHHADVSFVSAFIGHGNIWAFSSFPRFGSDLGTLVLYHIRAPKLPRNVTIKHRFILWKKYSLFNHFLTVYSDCINYLLSCSAVLNIFVMKALSISIIMSLREIPRRAIYVSKNMHILRLFFSMLPNHPPEIYLSVAVYENSYIPTWEKI